MKRQGGAHQSVFTALIGVLISIMAALIQFLMIYWILNAYGSAINGFIRITTALSILGGSAEGALGITTVVLLMKPMADSDWISANEIISTTRRKYHKRLFTSSLLITLVAIIYPLQLVVFPMLIEHRSFQLGKLGIEIFDHKTNTKVLVQIWELMGIVFIFGLKQIISSSFFGIYENIIMADQKNGVRKTIILFTDVVVYGMLLFFLTRAIDGPRLLHPIIPLFVLLLYAPIRGTMMKLYVKRYYPWIKIYPDFNSYPLKRVARKMWRTNLGQNLLMNADILILFFVLGASGLTVTSMLSLYMIVGVNLRLILTNMIISFREYFIGVIGREGRLQWEAYSKYELYTFIIAAFAFIFMSIIAPYIVTGLYGNLIHKDLSGSLKANAEISLRLRAEWNVFSFIFTSPIFSGIYGFSVAFILLFQGQMTIIQAKGRFGEVANATNIIALVYLLIELIVSFLVYFFSKQDFENINYLSSSVLAFYIVKMSFMTIAYIYLWQYTWKFVTYNSTLKYIFSNLLCLFIPIAAAILLNVFLVSPRFPLEIAIGKPAPVVSIAFLLGILVIVGSLGLASSLVLPLVFRPQVGISIIISLPVIKQILSLKKEQSKLKRYRQENVDVDQLLIDQKAAIAKAFYGIDQDQQQEINESDFLAKYQTIDKPKVYKIKGTVSNNKIDK